MERRLQLLTSLAFFVLCLVGIAVGARSLMLPPALVARGPATRPVAPPPMYQAGESISVAGVDFAVAEQTLLLVVRKGCRFCDESMPFYKQLGDDGAVSKRTRIVMVAPDEEVVSREELARNQVRVDQVVRLGLAQLKVRGTPTAILVNRTGVVQRVLVGRLDDARQTELVAALRGLSRP